VIYFHHLHNKSEFDRVYIYIPGFVIEKLIYLCFLSSKLFRSFKVFRSREGNGEKLKYKALTHHMQFSVSSNQHFCTYTHACYKQNIFSKVDISMLYVSVPPAAKCDGSLWHVCCPTYKRHDW